MNYKKLIAGVMAVTLMSGGAFLPADTIKTLSDSIVMSASAAENYSCDSFDFDASTGTMTLKGNVNADDIKNFSQKESVISITAQKGTAFPFSCEDLFYGYKTVKSINLKNVNTSYVTNMSHMFGCCFDLTSLDISSFDTSNVTNMSDMFVRCSSLTSLNISNFDTSKVTDMGHMFWDCRSLTSLDLSNFDTSKVTDMGRMINGCSSLTSLDVSSFNTSNVRFMCYMFDGCSSLTSLDVSSFNTSNVIFMYYMFDGCSSLTSLDVSSFNTSNVTDMKGMFGGCSSLTSLDLSSFNTSNITDMSYMFSGCSSLTSLDVSSFNTSNVRFMSYMFKGCSSLTSLDLSDFNTSRVRSMESMFFGCSSLISLDLICFDTDYDTIMSGMFVECSSLEEIYCSYGCYNYFRLYGGLSTNVKLKNTVSTADIAALSEMIEKYTPENFVFSKTLPENYTTGNITLGDSSCKGYYDKYTDTLTICGDDGKKVIAPDDCSGLFEKMKFLKTVDLSGLNTYRTTNMSKMFYGCSNLESVNLSGLDTSSVTDMSNMFYGCTNLKSIDMSKLNTSNVQNFSGIFRNCSNLTNANLSGLVTPAATNMNLMFTSCSSLESVDMTGWNTANVTSMRALFSDCESLLSLDLRGWNTSSVTNMQGMFSSCRSLKSVDVSGFETVNVTTMDKMFQYCWSLEKLDLRSFDILSSSTVLSSMFANAAVKEIACTAKEYNKYVSEGSLSANAVRVSELCSPAEFNGNTMSLGGSISVNFYTLLKDIPLEQLEKSYVEFTVNGKTQTAKFNADKMNGDKTKYGFTCVLNSISMADDINAKLVYFDKYGIQHTTETVYTAQTYINTAIAKSTNAKMVTLAKSINDYGYYMQKYLSKTNSWVIGTDHIGMAKAYTTASAYSSKKSTYLSELSSYKKTETLKADIAKVNYSLSLDSDTAINVKITPAESYTGSIKATVDGKNVALTKQSDGRYALKIANIPAHELSTMHTIAITTTKGTSTYKVSALSFAYDCINAGTSNAERYNAACALYEYYKAAKAYKG